MNSREVRTFGPSLGSSLKVQDIPADWLFGALIALTTTTFG